MNVPIRRGIRSIALGESRMTCVMSSLGKKPVNGGRPPIDSSAVIIIRADFFLFFWYSWVRDMVL